MADLGHMDAGFAQKLDALIAASGGRLSIASGYRSVARQQQLWDAALKKYGSAAAARKWVAPPGNSKHNEGIAADLKGDLKWAHANAAKFGLYFPLANENWHIEPAGSRGKAAKGIAYDPANDTGNGDPSTLAASIMPNLHDPQVQVANFLSILASPDPIQTATF